MLTVLFATKDRAEILREVLSAYCRLQAPSSGWKLVVVDNGSTDLTTEVFASFADQLPLQSIREERLGKNVALNTGLAHVEGDLVVLSDDDAFPRFDWLLHLRKVADTHPEFTMFGGSIFPRWETKPPDWIGWLEDPGPVYTITDPLLPEGPVPAYLVFGPNMVIRRKVFETGTLFDPSIGPRGDDYPMGSETELLLRLERQGHKAWYAPGAVVEHLVRKDQMEQEWVLRRAFRYGRGRFRMSPNVKLWMGVPRHLFRDLPKERVAVAIARLLRRRKERFRALWRFNVLRGMAIEARAMYRQ